MGYAQKTYASTELPSAPLGRLRYLAARLHYAHHCHTARKTEKPKMIAFPEHPSALQKELNKSKLLGTTNNGQQIFLFDYHINSSVIRELGRLRELTFRAVGEGTHKPRDIDSYDKTYRHIVLWNERAQEIVGAYRIGEAFRLKEHKTPASLYTHELFKYENQFSEIYPYGIELGRSFIQPKYWSKRGLDLLWQGIGAYLRMHPHVRYLFGGVSLSNDYPELAKQQIIGLYRYFFRPENAAEYASSRMPYQCNRAVTEVYRGKTFDQAQRELSLELASQDLSIPTLFKHYVSLCHSDGVKFMDFNIDPEFSYCIDGLILVDLTKIKDSKKRRYLTPNA
ncbi:hypothetical protein NBRC116583_26730 [Arenicella sp. 4NH20-0111]|uniref:GNAT family N-acetyltransferase n=1 Tax=Arenicella sp. 4NH20-0111 TaxID=3127648 RepID=UPI003101C357